jgi:alpha-tubulin suppressor-like RCC1 family protein
VSRQSGQAWRRAVTGVAVVAGALAAGAAVLSAPVGAAPAAPAAATVAPGAVLAWGYNRFQEVDPAVTAPYRSAPAPVAGLPGTVTQVASGTAFGYALLSDGTVRAWGNNTTGDLGNGTTTAVRAPVQVSGLTSVTQVTAGNGFGLAVRGGTVMAWGDNSFGQLGDDNHNVHTTPTQVPGLTRITQVVAGEAASYALASDGTVWAWGANFAGQLGDGTNTGRSAPAKVPGLTAVTALSAGTDGDHVLALRSDHTVWAWGSNNFGQLGDGTTTGRSVPAQIAGLTGITQIAAGVYSGLALDSTGAVRAWGANDSGQLGDGTTTAHLTPVGTGLTGVAKLVSGGVVGGAVRANGTVLVWGANTANFQVPGTLGIGSSALVVPTPTQVPGLAGVRQLSIGSGLYAITDPAANQPEQYGFVWAHDASAALNTPYTPNSSYATNSTGGAISVTHTGTGTYRVTFGGLGGRQPAGNVQVTAKGNTTNRCKAESWGASGAALAVSVRCHTAAGALADTVFIAQYLQAGTSRPNQQAYLLADQPGTASYTAPAAHAFSSRGGTMTVTRSGAGTYRASLGNFSTVGGDVAITAVGTDSNYCKVVGWGVAVVDVGCFTAAGAPADTAFALRYTDRHVGNRGGSGAYAWANDSTSASYTPSATYQWTSSATVAGGNAVTATRSGTGSYAVTIPAMAALDRSSAMVTAYGGGSATCNVVGWDRSGSSAPFATAVTVTCHTSGGALTDSLYTVSYVTNF